ncbi:MAG: adenylate/guanylate cyclase domain-containing protein [Chloroflexota bacterium]
MPDIKRWRLLLSTRFALATVLVAVLSMLIVALLGWQNGQSAMNSSTRNRLEATLYVRAVEVEEYFERIQKQVASLALSETFSDATIRFSNAYITLPKAEPSEELIAYYLNTVVPEIRASTVINVDFRRLVPSDPRTVGLHELYVVQSTTLDGLLSSSSTSPPISGTGDSIANENDSEEDISDEELNAEFIQMTSQDANTLWSQIHDEFDDVFRAAAMRAHYDDLLLISSERTVVYSVNKGIELGTNLATGPFRATSLSNVVNQIFADPHPEQIHITDFDFYPPAGNQPMAFIAAPVYRSGRLAGVLAVRISTHNLNLIVTGGGQWTQEGLGQTGEIYIVGPDRRMRSISRFFAEDPNSYVSTSDLDGETKDAMRALGTTILTQPADTVAVEQAFSIDRGSLVSTNYRGDAVLSAYEPLGIPGLEWSIIAEMSQAEAFESNIIFRRRVLISAVIILALVTFLSTILGENLVSPLRNIRQLVHTIRTSAVEASSNLPSQPSLNPASPSVIANRTAQKRDIDFNTSEREMIQRQFDTQFTATPQHFQPLLQSVKVLSDRLLQTQHQHTALQNDVNTLISQIIPQRAQRRLMRGEGSFVEEVDQASVVVVRFSGLNELATTLPAEDIQKIANHIVSELDDLALSYELDRVSVGASYYIAVCGLDAFVLDHVRRATQFAIGALYTIKLAQIQLRNQKLISPEEISASVGVHTDTLLVGLLSEEFEQHYLIYEVWGPAVNSAMKLAMAAEPGQVLIHQAATAYLDRQEFEGGPTVGELGETVQLNHSF